jgi:hypothetical protein
MAVKLSTAVRNARLDAIETTIGTSPKLQFRTGAAPANPAASDSGTLLVEITCPSDWANAASGGSKTLAGSWSGSAVADGTAAHWRLKDSTGATCHEQGSITSTGGGGDIELSTTTIVTGGLVSVTAFTQNDGNA